MSRCQLFTPIDKIYKETQRLAKLELSWSDHLVWFKMLLLPQILYISRTLPIPLHRNHLKSLNSLLTQFIWSSKWPQCSKVLLVKQRLADGMGLIDIQDYFRASILTQLKSWFSPAPDILWSGIEQSLSPTKDLLSLLLLDVWRPFPIQLLPLTIQASLWAWRDLRKLPLLTSNKVDIPILLTILNHVIPNLSNTDWCKWIKWIANLYHTDYPKPFTTL